MSTELPSGWSWKTLGEIADWSSGGTPRRTQQDHFGGEIPWAVIGDLNDETVTKCRGSLTHAGLSNSNCKVVEPGTILIAMYGSIGKLGIAGMPMTTNQAIASAVPRIDSLYLFYYLLSQRSQLAGAGKGATQRNISQSILKAWPIPVAPLAEQECIVAAIEEHFSRLNAVESAIANAHQRLDALRSSIMDRAFYDDTKSARTAEIGDLAEVSGGIQKQPKRRPRKNRYPFLRVANVGRGQLNLAEVHEIELFEGEIDRFRLKQGDLLVVEGNGSANQIGRAALWDGEIDDCVHQNHLIRVRPGDELLPEYLALCWNAPRTAQGVRAVASSTSGLYTLSTSKVKSIHVPVVPLPVQEEVVNVLDQRLSSIESACSAAADAVARTLAVRRAVLAQAFAGRLVPQKTWTIRPA